MYNYLFMYTQNIHIIHVYDTESEHYLLLRVLMGPPLIARTSLRVAPS